MTNKFARHRPPCLRQKTWNTHYTVPVDYDSCTYFTLNTHLTNRANIHWALLFTRYPLQPGHVDLLKLHFHHNAKLLSPVPTRSIQTFLHLLHQVNKIQVLFNNSNIGNELLSLHSWLYKYSSHVFVTVLVNNTVASNT